MQVSNSRKLTNSQNELLKLLYKFRFANSQLLSSHKHKSRATTNKTLTTLLDRKLISRNYNSSYKLSGRGAEYYLTNLGIRYLRDNYPVNEAVLHAMYKNKSIGQPFIQKCLLIYEVYIKLQKQYGNSFVMYSKAECAEDSKFPQPLSDLYIQTDTTEYLLDIFTDNLFYLVKKRIDLLVEHYESGDWASKPHPTLLLVFPDSGIEAKAQSYVEKVKDDNYIEEGELIILVTTQKVLQAGSEQAIWSTNHQDKPQDLLHL